MFITTKKYLLMMDVIHFMSGMIDGGVGTCAYRKVASFNTSCLEAHAGVFRLLVKGIFDPYVW